MSAHALASTVAGPSLALGDIKTAIVTVTGSSSYDAGGSIIDLSTIFPSKAIGAAQIATAPHASAKYRAVFIRGTSDGPTLGKLKIYDNTTDPGAEASGDLSGTTFTLQVIGQ